MAYHIPYEDEQDYLISMFRHQFTNFLPFSYWSNPHTRRIHTPYEDEFGVQVSEMRCYLDLTYETLRAEVLDEVKDKFCFFGYHADQQEGRQMGGVFVQYMDNFTLHHRFMGAAIGKGNVCHEAIARALIPEDCELAIEPDLACTGMRDLVMNVSEKLLSVLTGIVPKCHPFSDFLRYPSAAYRAHGFNPDDLPGKKLELLEVLDPFVSSLSDDKHYTAGDFMFGLRICEEKLVTLNTREARQVLEHLLTEKKTLLQKKQFLGALLVDPRVNNRENAFLSKDQKEIALNHLMLNHHTYKEKVVKASIESVTEEVTKLELGKPPQKGLVRKKLRGLESREPLPHYTDVLAHWRERQGEEPELAVLAQLAFAETAPWASDQIVGLILDKQRVSDEEMEKLFYIHVNTAGDEAACCHEEDYDSYEDDDDDY